MSISVVSGRSTSFYTDVREKTEYTKGKVIKNIIMLTEPLSYSKPVYLIISIAKKCLKLGDYFCKVSFLPLLAKSLDGLSDIAGIGGFIHMSIKLIPCLTATTLNEAALEKSIKAELIDDRNDPITNQKIWTKRILKQTKLSLKNRHTTKAVRKEISEMIIRKLEKDGVTNLSESEKKARSYAVVQLLDIKAKHRPLVEKIYTSFFFFASCNGFLNTLNRLAIINMAKISATIGKILVATKIPMILGSKVTKTICKVSLNQLARVAGLIGSSIQVTYDSYKLFKIFRDISNTTDPTERAKLAKERTKKICSLALGILSLIGGIVPLFLAVNPVALLTYEIAIVTLGLVRALVFD